MKILLDDNLSPKLIGLLSNVFPEITHVHNVGLGSSADMDIWQWAKVKQYMICTKDSDFYHQAVLYGPPKVIWLRLGNCSNRDVVREIRQNIDAIKSFAANSEQEVLILG